MRLFVSGAEYDRAVGEANARALQWERAALEALGHAGEALKQVRVLEARLAVRRTIEDVESLSVEDADRLEGARLRSLRADA